MRPVGRFRLDLAALSADGPLMPNADEPASAPSPSGLAAGVLGVILAGGEARRMGGGDKGLRLVGRSPLLSYVIARLSPQVPALRLNANGPAARFAAWGMEVIPDPVAGRPGPLAGVLAGMEAAQALGLRKVVTAAWDTPFLPRDLVARLSEAEAPVVMAETEAGPHPTFALWDAGLAPALREALEGGTRKVRDFAEAQGGVRVRFPSEPWDPFFNVNTPLDIEEAERLWRDVVAPAEGRPVF